MSRLKRVFTLGIVALFSVAFLAGCALFGVDVYFRDNMAVAYINAPSGRIIVTHRQLSNAYNNFGWQFVQQGMTPEEAVRETLDILINREIMVYLSTQNQFFGSFGSGMNMGNRSTLTQGTRALTQHEYDRARRTAFTAMERSIQQIHNQIREERGLADTTAEPPSPPQSQPTFTPYEHYISTRVVGGVREFTLNVSRFETPEDLGAVPTIEEFLATAFAPRNETETERNIARDTQARYVRLLRNAEQGLNFTGDQNTDMAVLRREIDRILIEEEKNILVSRFRDMHEQGVTSFGRDYFELFTNRHNTESELQEWRDAVQIRNQAYVNDLVQRAITVYEREIRLAKDRIARGIDTVEGIGHGLLDGLDGVFYVPAQIVHHYFTVSHILIGFTDAQQEEYRQLQNRLRTNQITEDDFNNQVQVLRNAARGLERDADGQFTGNEFTAEQVLAMVQTHVNPQGNQPAFDKVTAFREMIYRFNTDPGMNNPQFEYVIGIEVRDMDNNNNPIGPEQNSRMVEPFTDAARELYNFQGTLAGGRPQGNSGDMSGLVWTEFGAHIIMYTRPLSEFIFSNSLTMLTEQRDRFLFATQTSYGNQTTFDTILQGLSRRTYQSAEDSIISTFKQQIGRDGILIHERRFRDLWR
ncbi:MAG: hypothetical protein FWE16_00005 [Firmicutes bacterium]|nr:hypothetical protein [Bacillota bacterium]